MSYPHYPIYQKIIIALLMVQGLLSCGGGSDSGSNNNQNQTPPVVPQPTLPPTDNQASRFLIQASFGSTETDITAVKTKGYETWINEQIALPVTTPHQDHINSVPTVANQTTPNTWQNTPESFWRNVATANDVLRWKTAYALSQIFVISTLNDEVGQAPKGVAHYMDMLGKNAFGNFRTLLEDVSLHPMMGLYLTHLKNQKESGNRVPDENYAREVMQLFTIGLHELNIDGSMKIVNGKPIDTYTNSDISGLAKVFTGWSWAGPDLHDGRFYGWNNFKDINRDILPMQNYPKFYSLAEKKFLGTTIAQGVDAPESLKIALDTLFNHPNVGPFIAKQLIQRLVTSNPSPTYIKRVAEKFNNNGSGVRGDMKAVIKAILLDVEARSDAQLASNNYGKVKEPLLRLAQWLKTFNPTSTSTRYTIGGTDDPAWGLAQTPMRAPSVFNFFRPGYVAPKTSLATANLVAPELQLTHETSVAGYVNYMLWVIDGGIGSNRDVKASYATEKTLANNPNALLDRINLLLFAGQMDSTLRTRIKEAIVDCTLPGCGNTEDKMNENRVKIALGLAFASPQFLVQR